MFFRRDVRPLPVALDGKHRRSYVRGFRPKFGRGGEKGYVLAVHRDYDVARFKRRRIRLARRGVCGYLRDHGDGISHGENVDKGKQERGQQIERGSRGKHYDPLPRLLRAERDAFRRFPARFFALGGARFFVMRLRALQDETGGFKAFVPLPFRKGKSSINANSSGVYALKICALARIILDNFEHVRTPASHYADRFEELMLYFGADDLGGTYWSEEVAVSAGAKKVLRTENDLRQTIARAGFEPVRTNSNYDL